MMTTAEVRELITDLFEEEALVIGGMAAVHGLDDETIWRVVRNIDVIRGRILCRLEAKAGITEPASPPCRPEPRTELHPAVEDFLLTLRRA
ncbi:MAG: hypothetical protein JXB46_09995 [Candidatus Eisenbacteria bacterium]|nr:hypothetical protein [Candidatus Eisenbacteria bacterium]